MPDHNKVRFGSAEKLAAMTSASARTPPWQSETLTDVLSIQLYIPIGHASGDSLGQNSGSQLYSPEERKRRDSSVWTLVQGVLAPLQFLIFLVSLVLVVRYLATGEGYLPATASIVIKTFALYAIMITGSIWEKVVFGRYLFAPAFFWEDVFSMLVLALHTAYLAALYLDALAPRELMVLALAAYAAYVVNAAQFLLKLRAARRDSAGRVQQTSEMIGHVQ